MKENKIPNFFNQQLNVTSNLKTQVEILSSPSILFDIFNFVKAQKNIFNPGSSEDLRYDDWLENLDIELKKATSVLNLSYRDIDKDLILPVLKRISSAYQEYAGSKRNKDIEFGLKYLDKEIDIYKKKSFASFIKSSNFAKENKLDLLYVNPYSVENQTGVIPKLNSLNILFSSEESRIEDAAKLENTNARLDLIEKYKNDPDKKFNLIRKIAKEIDELKFMALDELENLIVKNRSIYKENDPKIQQLLIRKEFLLKDIEKNVISYLISQRELLEAEIKITSRPQNVIDKYKQLLSQAIRDQNILENLETERSILSVSKSRKDKPWQLITKPTILDEAVSLSRKKILLFEMLKFLIFGIIASFLLDKKDGFVYIKRKIEILLDCKLIQELSIDNKESWPDLLGLLSDKLTNVESFSIIPLGNIDNSYINKFSQDLSSVYKKSKVTVTKNFIESVNSKVQLIIVSPGSVKKEQIVELNNFFSLTKSNLIGFFLLN